MCVGVRGREQCDRGEEGEKIARILLSQLNSI